MQQSYDNILFYKKTLRHEVSPYGFKSLTLVKKYLQTRIKTLLPYFFINFVDNVE
jgi:hypothetical protein